MGRAIFVVTGQLRPDSVRTAFISLGQTRDTVTWKGTSESGTYSMPARMTKNAPAIMNGPSGICRFLVTRPEISSAVP
jgi:hypothetical protein